MGRREITMRKAYTQSAENMCHSGHLLGHACVHANASPVTLSLPPYFSGELVAHVVHTFLLPLDRPISALYLSMVITRRGRPAGRVVTHNCKARGLDVASPRPRDESMKTNRHRQRPQHRPYCKPPERNMTYVGKHSSCKSPSAT